MFEYPAEIFGAKMREEKFGKGEEQYILYCYDILGGIYSVRFDGIFICSRFDYGEIHSSSYHCLNDFEGFERNAANLVNHVIAYLLEKEQGEDD
jgi:hypothetical protein